MELMEQNWLMIGDYLYYVDTTNYTRYTVFKADLSHTVTNPWKSSKNFLS